MYARGSRGLPSRNLGTATVDRGDDRLAPRSKHQRSAILHSLTAVHAANVLTGAGDFSHLGKKEAFDERHLENLGMADRKDN